MNFDLENVSAVTIVTFINGQVMVGIPDYSSGSLSTLYHPCQFVNVKRIKDGKEVVDMILRPWFGVPDKIKINPDRVMFEYDILTKDFVDFYKKVVSGEPESNIELNNKIIVLNPTK